MIRGHAAEGQTVSDHRRIALLIDCDNVSYKAIEGVLEELSKLGMVNVRHAHGDWNSASLSGWRDQLHPNAIRPMQQFAYTKGKNATDAAMIIDAMDLLYSGSVDAFALMTSDSDFTPLVLRLLESGFPVYGFGAQKTPQPFVDACSSFVFTENLEPAEKGKKGDTPTPRKTRAQLRQDAALVKLLRNATEQAAEDDGWAAVSQVGSLVANNRSFNTINYGYTRLTDLIKATDFFDIEMRRDGSVMYIRDKRK